ncbi:Small-conductance mechanosensitive channel [Halogranum gelatinilyticum]|uniref:Small-conductance mechanosensitive channel n=1 Tax=Halogranum gelatinilyticum TaxID=660521 RepID=A0A1G9T1T0_9EURY|nr:mechanosensitive ion channel family protein [Halogranum gelatinilyticum]SDM41641.1 Small-conductance mechanosensitive channel [Halogranum gelatinilyticum]
MIPQLVLQTSAPTTTPTGNSTAASDPLGSLLSAVGQGLFPDGLAFGLQVLLTIIIVAVVLIVRYYEDKWVQSHSFDSVKRVAIAGGIALFTAVGVLLLIDVWELGTQLRDSFGSLRSQRLAGRVLISAVLIGITYTLSNFVGRVIQVASGSGDAISRHQQEIIYRLTQIGMYATVVLVVLSLFTQDIGSLLVGAGFLGIIVGMAARQTLGSVLAGFVLMLSRPFEIGDWIAVDDHEGTVTDITIVDTRIQTFDGEYVILPNDQISGGTLVNRTRKGRLRLEVEIGVDYATDPERAAEVALEAVEELDELMGVPSPRVVLKRFADSSVILGVRVWIDNPSARRKWRARTAVISAVKYAFEEEGIKIPFPQRELSSRDAEGDVPLAGGGERHEATTDGGGDE